jgi:hypothetical protein
MDVIWGLRARRGSRRCGATEVLLRSGRAELPSAQALRAVARSGRTPPPDRAEIAVRELGRRLGAALSLLAPYRTAPDDRLRSAYAEVHSAITELATAYVWLTLASRPARPAPPARRRRPSGG